MFSRSPLWSAIYNPVGVIATTRRFVIAGNTVTKQLPVIPEIATSLLTARDDNSGVIPPASP
jgi:hypothetical protein